MNSNQFETFIQEGEFLYYAANRKDSYPLAKKISGFSVRDLSIPYKKMISCGNISLCNNNNFKTILLDIDDEIHLKKAVTYDNIIKFNNLRQIKNFVDTVFNALPNQNISVKLLQNTGAIEINTEYKNISSIAKCYSNSILLIETLFEEIPIRSEYIINSLEDTTNLLNNLYFSKDKYECLINIRAPKFFPRGKYDIIFTNGTAGILFHEICGHQFELSKDYSINSPVKHEPQYKISKSLLTIYDESFRLVTPQAVDDEGNKKKKALLIKNGHINIPLTDKRTINLYPHYDIVGNARRESYLFYPEPRMFCTLVENGSSNLNEMVNETDYGILVESISEAHIEHRSGRVKIFTDKAKVIKNGIVTNINVLAVLEDFSSSFFNNIQKVASDLKIVPGYCSSNSGVVYVEYGAPSIKFTNLNLLKGWCI